MKSCRLMNGFTTWFLLFFPEITQKVLVQGQFVFSLKTHVRKCIQDTMPRSASTITMEPFLSSRVAFSQESTAGTSRASATVAA